MKKSTKAFMREAKEIGESFPKQVHSYAYLKWTREYVKWLSHHTIPNAGAKKREKWENNYHAKVLTLGLAENVITLDKDIPLTDLEQIIPYKTARKLVMKAPTDVVLYECACRWASGNNCKPSRVCMVIGKPFTDAILEQHPDMAHRATKEEALALLRDEDKRGHIHTAWFKDVNLDRFYAICNCCKCCCVGVLAMNKFGMRSLSPSGYVTELDEARCTNCGKCAEACPFGAISFTEKKLGFDWDKCMGCGVCVSQCPKEARSLVRDEKKGIPMDIREIADGPARLSTAKTSG